MKGCWSLFTLFTLCWIVPFTIPSTMLKGKMHSALPWFKGFSLVFLSETQTCMNPISELGIPWLWVAKRLFTKRVSLTFEGFYSANPSNFGSNPIPDKEQATIPPLQFPDVRKVKLTKREMFFTIPSFGDFCLSILNLRQVTLSSVCDDK